MENIVVGINWGGVKEEGWFGAPEYKSVDNNINVLIIDKDFNIIEHLSWKNKKSDYVIITKDDTSGDTDGNDYKDNEHAVVNISNMPDNYTLIFFVDNYTDQRFGQISHFDYRVYYGEPDNPDTYIHQQDITSLESYENYENILLGYMAGETKEFSHLDILINSSNDMIENEVVKIFREKVKIKNI